MANIKSSQKSIRKIAKLTVRNKAEKTRLKTFSKKLQKLQLAQNATAIKAMAIEYMSVIDKAGKHSVLHTNKVNRMKSRITPLINVKIETSPSVEDKTIEAISETIIASEVETVAVEK